MITSRRDYVLRLIEEVGRLLSRVVAKRRAGDDQDALGTVVFGFQRLFNLEANQIFQFTPDQHFEMLCDTDTPEDARDKVLLYAALSAEAGRLYTKQGNRAMARATTLNALRFTLKARAKFPTEGQPDYTPNVEELKAALADEPLDAETAALVAQSR
jgi:hypothetical protein